MPRRIVICLSVILFIGLNIPLLSSPGDSIANLILDLPPIDRIQALWDKTYPPPAADTLQAVNIYRDMQNKFAEEGELVLSQRAWIISVFYNTVFRHPYDQTGIAYIDKAIEEADQRNWQIQEAECIVIKGLLYYKKGKFGPGFEFMQKGYHRLQESGFENCPGIKYYLQEIGQAYYEFGDYQGALQFLREGISVAIPSAITGPSHIMRNTLALTFQKLDQLDSAIYYFCSAHEEAKKANNSFWMGLTHGNLGYVLYLQGKYDEAVPLLEKDFLESKKANEWGSAVNAAMALATMALKKGQVDTAENYLAYAEKNINYKNYRELAGYYKNMSAISRLKGDFPLAFSYIDSFQIYTDSVRKLNDARIINQSKLKVEVEHHSNEVKLLEASRSRQVLMRNGLLIILALSSVIGLLWTNRVRIKRDKEKELALMRQSLMEDELENAKRELELFTNTLKEKNSLIENFRSEIDYLQHSGITPHHERTEQITQLLNSTILTEEDWKQFRLLFDKVHPGFFIRLREKMPDLSPADTRLLSLIKLQLAPKEMASMLGITYEAIKKSRQRLRKKVNLPEDGSWEELVEKI